MNLFERDWLFTRNGGEHFEEESSDDCSWESVDIPHDWAAAGPFSKENDPEIVIVDPMRNVSTTYCHPGRTGGLPHVGAGFYRKHFPLDWKQGQSVRVEFDGIMSHSKVFCNGHYAGGRPYGYSSFAVDLTPFVRNGENLLAVRAENLPGASRWYPGAGIYRHARLVVTEEIHVAYHGIRIHTQGDKVFVRTVLENPAGKEVSLTTLLLDPSGKELFSETSSGVAEFRTEFGCGNAERWQPGNPVLYKIVSIVGKERIETRFGFRDMIFDPDKGFFINGTPMKFQGVCLHHDLGPVGAAVNRDITKHRLNLLASIGCNAIRTSHNPPDPEMLDLCDELGFLVICEAFDEWKRPKTPSGYNLLFDEWGERDLRDMIRRDANHPCVMMWSIGNEIDEQYYPEGPAVTRRLCDICHDEDPTRPTTAGLNNADDSITGGLFDVVDVKGFNYKPYIYSKYHAAFPEAAQYSSESASTISSRGEYSDHIFEELGRKENLQIDSFDLCNSPGATTPDHEFKGQDDNPFVMGEFVWTGFDYLGEPTPYREEWPVRSSFYGIFDLCGIPKDRAFLYRSRWTNQPVLHLMPHWNWEGFEGKSIPVQCYSSFRRVELFVNDVSCGVHAKNPKKLFGTYRHVWSQVPYQPGILKVNALDENGNVLASEEIRTAGAPDHLKMEWERCGEMVFATVTVVDRDGNPCPHVSGRIDFESSGKIVAADAGDPTSTKPFPLPYANAFHGKCAVWIRCPETVSVTAGTVLNGKEIQSRFIVK